METENNQPRRSNPADIRAPSGVSRVNTSSADSSPHAPVGEPPTPSRPRVWTVFLSYVLTIGGMVAASGVVAGVYIASLINNTPVDQQSITDIMKLAEATANAPWVILSSFASTALVLITMALSCAALSPVTIRRRLALRSPGLDTGVWAAAMLAGVSISTISDGVIGAMGLAQTGTIAHLTQFIQGLSPGMILPAIFAIGVVAPFAEELFFRGYVQTRLCRRWGAWPGILITAALFGLSHFDWVHTPSAFVMGIYLGWLAQRTGSLLPSIGAHAVNNILWSLFTWAELDEDFAHQEYMLMLGVCLIVSAVALRWLAPRISTSQTR